MSVPPGSPQVEPSPSDVSSQVSGIVPPAGRPWRRAVGSPRARVWIGIAGGVALAAALVVPFVSRAAHSEHPVALTSLTPGSCFQLPSRAYLQAHHDAADADARVREVVLVTCAKPHRGEVVAQAVVDPGRLRYNDSAAASHAACREPFANYNPDFWALPANADLALVPPREQDSRTTRSRPAST